MSCRNPDINNGNGSREGAESVREIGTEFLESDWRNILLWGSFIIAVLSFLRK